MMRAYDRLPDAESSNTPALSEPSTTTDDNSNPTTPPTVMARLFSSSRASNNNNNDDRNRLIDTTEEDEDDNAYENTPLHAHSSSAAAGAGTSSFASASTSPHAAPSSSPSGLSPAPYAQPFYAQAPRGSPPTAQAGNDGVFANLSAKQESSAMPQGKIYEELEPPTYAEAAHDTAPSYYETSVIANVISEDGEVLIDGMPVGDLFTYFVNMLVSMSFDFIGFLLTSILATSHAAKCGSRSGFGMTLIRYAFYLRSREVEESLADYSAYDPSGELNPEDAEELAAENYWMSYFLLVMGFFISMRAMADYVHAKRLQAVILASSDTPQATVAAV
ncbi:hypothetical protein DFS34DRAFT_264242 [Phlyctochytrium arcticum]|nr:hypothetical protein DFS34DRAFT_264242 [Phlyctochytrium arcticum]